MSKSKPEPIAAAAPDRKYIVLTPLEKGGEVYPVGSTIALTDEEADYPLEVGAVKPKAAELVPSPEGRRV